MKQLLFLALWLVPCWCGYAAVLYTVTLLEAPIDAYVYSPWPSDISDTGWVTGLAASAGGPPYDGAQVMWYYTPQEGYQVVGTYQGYHVSPRAVNNSGQVALMASSGPNERALRYTPGMGFEDLGNLGGTSPGSEHGAMGINNSGQVVGYSDLPSGVTHAFRYTDGMEMQDLGSLSTRYSWANDINDAGHVTGRSSVEGVTHAFLYTDEMGMVDLGPGVGVSINSHDVVAGGSPLWGGPVIFRDGRMRAITYFGGMQWFGIGSINDANVVVGGYISSAWREYAFIATEDSGMVDLNSLIDPNCGWLLTSASAINNRGQIVGQGIFEGRETAFRLDPIPPRLEIELVETNVVITWSPQWPGLVLETAPYHSPTNWQAVPGGTNSPVTLPATGAGQVFRLSRYESLDPKLTVSVVGTNLVLAWAPPWPDYAVEIATNLTAPAWSAIPEATTSPMTVPTPGTAGYFRLRK